jgi:hypothetical protein
MPNSFLPSGLPWAKGRLLGATRLAARMGVALLLSTSIVCGYSVLTHEAIVDSLWDASIQKMLLKRFPM